MKMLLPVTLLMIFSNIVKIHAQRPSVPDHWKVIKNNERHIPIPIMDANDEIIFVSGSLKTTEAIKLDYISETYASCIVPQTLKYNSISKRQAYPLKNGKVIVSLLNSKMERNNPTAGALEMEWIVSIIDPTSSRCRHKHIKVAGPGEVLVMILPYSDTFDLLLRNADRAKGPESTKVVRYSDSGDIIDDNAAQIPDLDYLKILLAKQYDPSQGYYYMLPNRQRGNSIMNRLNSNFQITHSLHFKHSKYLAYDVNSYSVEYNHFSICYFPKENRKNLECKIVPNDLRFSTNSVKISLSRESYYINLENLPNGDAVLIYAMNYDKGKYYINVRRIKKELKVAKEQTIGKIESEIHDLYTFLKKDGNICIVVLLKDSASVACISNY